MEKDIYIYITKKKCVETSIGNIFVDDHLLLLQANTIKFYKISVLEPSHQNQLILELSESLP